MTAPPFPPGSVPVAALTREDVLDARQVADLLGLPPSTVLDYARRRILPARKLGRRWIFLRDEIETRLRHGSRDRDPAAALDPPPAPPAISTRASSLVPPVACTPKSARQSRVFG